MGGRQVKTNMRTDNISRHGAVAPWEKDMWASGCKAPWGQERFL